LSKNQDIMKKLCFVLSTLLITYSLAFSQSNPTVNSGGGGIEHSTSQNKCLSGSQRAFIKKQLEENIQQLKAASLLKTNTNPEIVSFDFPLQKTAALDYSNFYGISNYVDHDATAGIVDYECNARSYNGHQGTDFFPWPFPWYSYENNLVEVISAAAGTIVFKQDGQFDQNCQWNNQNQWNAIYVQHADGSVAWYGHLKSNSLTTKDIGSSIAQGEYIGVVASSGISDNAHLHFEVRDDADNLIDPYQGNCNNLNSDSWWQTQLPYSQMRINAALTHSAPPVHDCPAANEVTNFNNNFIVGETVYVGAYYKDQIAGQTATYTIRRPDLSVWDTWDQNFQQNFNASWWWWPRDLPEEGPFGTWRFDIELNGETVIHSFEYLETNLPIELTSFTASLTKQNTTLLDWQTASETNNSGFEIEHSIDGTSWEKIGFVEGHNIADKYSHIHQNPQKGVNYYRLRQIDMNGDFEYSKIVSVEVNRSSTISIYPNPTKDKINIIGTENQPINIKIYNSTGILAADFTSNESEIDIRHLASGLYIISIQLDELISVQKIVKN